MVKRPRPEDAPDPEKSVCEEFYPKGRKRGTVVRIQADFSRKGRVLHYSLALVDTQRTTVDHGRILGYDNAHGFHHRHHLGKVESVEFTSYESIEARFEEEVRRYLKTGEI
jgi:hypothetical protein